MIGEKAMTQDCPVAPLAREARHLEAKCIEADEEGDTVAATEAENALNAVRDAASYLRPQSSIGAQFMLELIGLRADSMLDDNARISNLNAIERMTGALAEWAATQEQQRDAA
jgi:hypothetical protein